MPGEGRERSAPRGLSRLERALRPFADVRCGEGPTGIVLLAGVFLILAAYYFVKPARDGLLAASPIAGLSQVELKAYSSFGQSLVLLGAIPIYDRLASALSRRMLVTTVALFFASNLVLFWMLQPGLFLADGGWIGIAFYLWVGIFNVFIVAQFWGFAADIYSDEAGRRLFPMIAIGASAGAATGAWFAKTLVPFVGTYGLLLVAAALILVSIVPLRYADRNAATAEGGDGARGEQGADSSGGFRLILRHRYLIAVALLILVLNWVNTNGENFLFGAVEKRIQQAVAARAIDGPEAAAFVRDQTTRFYGDLFFWVNLVALLLQSFVASRVLRYGGFTAILMIPPLVSLVSYSTMTALPVLALVRVMKIAENATDYSLNNTAKQVLWLPTTTAMKYKAKAAIDTVFVRAGDGLAAATAFCATNLFHAPIRGLFALNAGLVLLWLALGVVVTREHARLVAARSRKGAPG